MRLTLDQLLADRRKMKAYIARLLPEEGTRIDIAEGADGELWIELYPVRHYDGEWDLHWETNCKEAIGLQEIYDHFRRQEMTEEERRRELTGEPSPQRIQALEKEVVVPDAGTGHSSSMGYKATAILTPDLEQPNIGSPGTLLDVKNAAKRIGCSVSGLRKLIAKRMIKFFRTKKWGRIRFKVEWLEEFIAKGVVAPKDETPVSVKKPRQTRLEKGRSRHGFDSALYDN